ncbi:MAG: hypothetical protein ACKOS8_11785 [Gemmataceae bacterium]
MLTLLGLLAFGQSLILDPPWQSTERAPHRKGNLYAPELVRDQGRWFLFYGAQGADGHDRIHLAVSTDGITWKRQGVVLEDASANHVNDPSVVVRDGVFHLYYTLAREGLRDVIALATSRDGILFEKQRVVLGTGKEGAWDSLLAGRPSILFEDGKFRLWYDGRKDLPLGSPDKNAPKSANSTRAVGLAESVDGKHFERVGSGPVFGNDAGGVHVSRLKSGYTMVYEGRQGTRWASSPNGTGWTDRGLLAPVTGTPLDRHGHVTPFLVPGEKPRLLIGAAMAPTWDVNRLVEIRLGADALQSLATVQ